MYVKFFVSKTDRMSQHLFRTLCELCDFDPELVECYAKKEGYTYQRTLNMDLIDFIGFDYPYEIYDVMK